MTLALTQSATAVAAKCPAYFLATAGSPPYTYSVITTTPGGTIDATTGAYTGPSVANSSPNFAYDIIQVTDATSATATARILVGTPLVLFCDIIQQGMGLSDGRVYLWDQKIFQPTDYDLYIAVSVATCKPYANINENVTGGSGFSQNQFVSMSALLDVDIISRGPAARDLKEQVVLAVYSQYAQQQQEINSFSIGRVPTKFLNLSYIDGAAIPYRFRISFTLFYAYQVVPVGEYFDSFQTPELVTST